MYIHRIHKMYSKFLHKSVLTIRWTVPVMQGKEASRNPHNEFVVLDLSGDDTHPESHNTKVIEDSKCLHSLMTAHFYNTNWL